MRSLLLTLIAAVWAAAAFADPPAAGDIIALDAIDCSLNHIDPVTGVGHVISRWGSSACGLSPLGVIVGTGPADWRPEFDRAALFVRPDGWIYLVGVGSPTGTSGWYRIEPQTGDRELVAVFTAGTPRGPAIWPEPSFFPSTVAALSIGAGVLLVGALVGLSRRRAK